MRALGLRFGVQDVELITDKAVAYLRGAGFRALGRGGFGRWRFCGVVGGLIGAVRLEALKKP